MAFILNRLDGVRIYYEVEGSGPPLVLFHGSMTSSSLWRQAGYVDALKDRYWLIMLDARGHGKSDKPRDEDDYAMERFVSDTLAVMDAAGVEQAHFWGYSLGARIGFGIGKYAPDRFRSLILGGGTYYTQPGAFDRVTFPGAMDTIATQGIEAFLGEWGCRSGTPIPEPIQQSFLVNDAKALVPYLRRIEREPSFEAAFPRMTMPVLLYAGERDLDRLEPSGIAAESLPDAQFVMIPDEDHVSTFAHRDKVLPCVTAFLERVSGVGAATT